MNRTDRARARSLRAVKAHNAALRPAIRPTHAGYATGPIRRSRATPLTPTQRNSEGRRSEWSASPEFFTDPKWSATVREVRA